MAKIARFSFGMYLCETVIFHLYFCSDAGIRFIEYQKNVSRLLDFDYNSTLRNVFVRVFLKRIVRSFNTSWALDAFSINNWRKHIQINL